MEPGNITTKPNGFSASLWHQHLDQHACDAVLLHGDYSQMLITLDLSCHLTSASCLLCDKQNYNVNTAVHAATGTGVSMAARTRGLKIMLARLLRLYSWSFCWNSLFCPLFQCSFTIWLSLMCNICVLLPPAFYGLCSCSIVGDSLTEFYDKGYCPVAWT